MSAEREDHDETRPDEGEPAGALSRAELEEEDGEQLPDREPTLNALSDQATLEQHPEAEEETTTQGGLDV